MDPSLRLGIQWRCLRQVSSNVLAEHANPNERGASADSASNPKGSQLLLRLAPVVMSKTRPNPEPE